MYNAITKKFINSDGFINTEDFVIKCTLIYESRKYFQAFHVRRELIEDQGFNTVKTLLHAEMLDIIGVEANNVILNDDFKIIEIDTIYKYYKKE